MVSSLIPALVQRLSTPVNHYCGKLFPATAYARQILSPTRGTKIEDLAKLMREALLNAVQAYTLAEGSPESSRFSPYNALNRLALDALTPWANPEQSATAIALAEQCHKAAALNFAKSASAWDAIMQPEAVLVRRVLDGTFGRNDESGKVAFDEIVRAYRETLSNLLLKPSELDSVVTQMELLARFHEALAKAERNAVQQQVAESYRNLAQQLQPGRKRPASRVQPIPSSVPITDSETPTPQARTTTARKGRRKSK